MKIVKIICKKKKERKTKKSFAFRCLTSGTTASWYEHILFRYSHLTFPDGSFCVSAAEVASPVRSAVSTNLLINLNSTEFYKHKHTLMVVYSQNTFTYINRSAVTAPSRVPSMTFTVSLSWGASVRFVGVGNTVDGEKLKTTRGIEKTILILEGPESIGIKNLLAKYWIWSRNTADVILCRKRL